MLGTLTIFLILLTDENIQSAWQIANKKLWLDGEILKLRCRRITRGRSFQPHLHCHNTSLAFWHIMSACLAAFCASTQSQTSFNLQSINTELNTTTMPVPMHSATSDQSTASSATAQTAQNVENASTQSVASTSHTEKTEQEKEAERLYEERMEEEYAKREGGA
jgi:hypothetical protein